ncbi:MAG: 50S ribosomal protein L33 [Cyanobacteria bacterium QS_8_64_29]|nr:MAG: 50S ribosomal protein L33 [Cyanobacteria bacterium QS_8_64_29]
MASRKGIRVIVTLECTECRTNPHQRTPGVSRYTTEKNRRNVSGRLELRKHCRYCNKHTVHKETK